MNVAVELDPKITYTLVERGILYYNMNEKDKALNDYNKAIEINPRCYDAHVNLGNLLKSLD